MAAINLHNLNHCSHNNYHILLRFLFHLFFVAPIGIDLWTLKSLTGRGHDSLPPLGY